MKKFDAGTLLGSISGLSNLAHLAQNNKKAVIPKENLKDLKNNISKIVAELESVGLPIALVSASALQEVISKGFKSYDEPTFPGSAGMGLVVLEGLSFDRFVSLTSDLLIRVRDELSSRVIVVLPLGYAATIQSGDAGFGTAFSQKFPTDGVFEADEAVRCVAFQRSTAAVFHLMRTLEVALKALYLALNLQPFVKGSDKNWGQILTKIKNELEKRDKMKTWPSTADKQFFEEAYVSFDAVRNVWRNSTMHVERKYTEEEVEHILAAVRGLMRKLAVRLDEDGLLAPS